MGSVENLFQKLHSSQNIASLHEKACSTPTAGFMHGGPWEIIFDQGALIDARCSFKERKIILKHNLSEEEELAFAVFELVNATRRNAFLTIAKTAAKGGFVDANAYAKAMELCEHQTILEYTATMEAAVDELKKNPPKDMSIWESAAKRYESTCKNPEFF